MFTELSLVDSPANTGARVVLAKRDDSVLGKPGFPTAEERGPQGPGHDKWRLLEDEIQRSHPQAASTARSEAWRGLTEGEKAAVRAEEARAGQTRKSYTRDDVPTAQEYYTNIVRRCAELEKRAGETVATAAARVFTEKSARGEGFRRSYQVFRDYEAVKDRK